MTEPGGVPISEFACGSPVTRKCDHDATVIGGAMLPHAPQFFTMPNTEDKDNVARVRQLAAISATGCAR